MKRILLAILTTFAALQLQAGVKVTSDEPTSAPAPAPAPAPSGAVEKRVAFVTAEKKYVTANTSGALDLSGAKVGSKQSFTLIDLNGGDLADGDAVKIRYTPNSGGVPDLSKASYWHEKGGGIKRSKEGDTFKIKKVETKFAFQTASGKFVMATVTDGAFDLSDKQDGALLVEIVDLPATGK
jgi:hypothetical protein